MGANYKYLSKTVNYYPPKSPKAPATHVDTESRITRQLPY